MFLSKWRPSSQGTLPGSPSRSWSVPLLIVVWLCLVAWRPAFFGFYHDDWSSVALPLERSGDLWPLVKADPGRPLYLVILYVLRPLLRDNVVLWQASLAMIHLMAAIALHRVASALCSDAPRGEGQVFGATAGMLWLVFPWSLGYSAWTVMLPPNLGMLLAMGAIALVVGPEPSVRKTHVSLLLLVASWLIYEATWMIWLPFSLVLLARSFSRPDRQRRRLAWRFAIGSASLQMLFVAWNRLSSAQLQAGKKLSANIISTFDSDRHLMLVQLLPSLQWRECLTWAMWLVLACLILNIRRWVFSPARVVVPLSLLLGLAISVIIYAAAGYAIEWVGLFSRVTLAISLWLSLLSTAIFALAWHGAAKPIKAALVLALAMVIACLAHSLLVNSLPWKKSWDEQQQILQALPQSVVDLADRDSLVLMDVPDGTPPVYTFRAFWDISGAFALRMSHYVRGGPPHAFATVARKGEWRTTWDGQTVRQYWCNQSGAMVWALEASKFYLWTYPQAGVVAPTAPYDSGCVPR
ncbi:hypothetical protein [Herbaspirillum sp. YR522]|uniref:hypothetical protein n=1 Tax=Herbaspirillum sp. YR522 TaxID=1144342 RepID=UPI00026F9145|nr:hypothetical protein [Herbaspirillum sp. YR522]EJN00860.1 hypothetical protein PMI40_03442 [Herbaspirillum sp. YR522]